MTLVNWHHHYEVRFGLRWYFTEMLYRITDLKVLVNFKTILGVGSGRAFTENLFSKDQIRDSIRQKRWTATRVAH